MTSAYKLMKERGVPTEGCMRYEAKDMQCIEINICRDCGHDYPCRPVQNYTKYFVEEYGYVSGEERMMKEIYARGPITCAIDATEELEAYKGGIFEDKTGTTALNHAISVVGWGEENGIPYWIVRNSWGTYWGEEGFFRIVRGKNNLGIEDGCTYGIPRIPEEKIANPISLSIKHRVNYFPHSCVLGGDAGLG